MLEKPTQIPIEDHLALTKVPMCHYGFLQILPLLSLIHNPLSFLSWTITTCIVDINLMLAFGPSNSPPLASNTEKEDISSTREGQIS